MENPRRLTPIAKVVIVTQIIFLAVVWLLPVASQFSLLSDRISELAIGRYGFIQTVAFIIRGLGSVALAYLIQKLTVQSKKSTFASWLIVIYGIGSVLSAFFPTDRVDGPVNLQTLTSAGAIQVVMPLISFVSVIIGMFILTWHFRKIDQWKMIARLPLVLLPCGAFTCFLVQSQGPWTGLMQRLLVTFIIGWLVVVATRCRRIINTLENQLFSASLGYRKKKMLLPEIRSIHSWIF